MLRVWSTQVTDTKRPVLLQGVCLRVRRERLIWGTDHILIKNKSVGSKNSATQNDEVDTWPPRRINSGSTLLSLAHVGRRNPAERTCIDGAAGARVRLDTRPVRADRHRYTGLYIPIWRRNIRQALRSSRAFAIR